MCSDGPRSAPSSRSRGARTTRSPRGSAAEGYPPFLAVYKPRRGEIPLWDFPDGTLYKRERAAYLTAIALGWDFIPPTVIRDGPHGIGSFQLLVDVEPRSDYFKYKDHHVAEVQCIGLFDVITNNADRKAGHVLKDRAGQALGHRPRPDLQHRAEAADGHLGLAGRADPRAAQTPARSVPPRPEAGGRPPRASLRRCWTGRGRRLLQAAGATSSRGCYPPMHSRRSRPLALVLTEETGGMERRDYCHPP